VRTHGQWLPRAVPPALLRELLGLAQCGPTSMNTPPMRVKCVASADARARLVACVKVGNVAKTRAAPVPLRFPGSDQ
jgi:3-hydroxypropanoate dehydrogenase